MEQIGEIRRRGKSVIEWCIKDFLTLPAEVDKDYDSPKFSFSDESWSLAISPNGNKYQNTEGFIDLWLWINSSSPLISMKFTLGVKTIDGEIDLERDCRVHFDLIYFHYAPKLLSRDELLKRKSSLLPSDTLTLVCRIKSLHFTQFAGSNDTLTADYSYFKEILDADDDIQSHLQKYEDLLIYCRNCSSGVLIKDWCNHTCQLTDAEGKDCGSKSSKNFHGNKVLRDYKELFLKQKECDVIIKVKGQEFPAHKTILAARSSVFESTFQNEVEEKETKETGTVDVEDCELYSFSDFLCFLYCGETDTLSEENVFSLFTTADKYDVEDLRDICVKFMKENMSVDTFCDTISTALLHSESELVTHATDFFIKNARKIVKTVQWQRYSADNPKQSNELIIKAFDAVANPDE